MKNNGKNFATYWLANKRLIWILLTIWAVVSFGMGILFVEPLNKIMIGKLPLGFWMAQQGSIYVFVILIFVYAWQMDRLDRKFHLDNDNDNNNEAPSNKPAEPKHDQR